jgi:hypothetical protein
MAKMPDKSPSILRFLFDLFLLMALGFVMFLPVTAAGFLCWIAWEVFRH